MEPVAPVAAPTAEVATRESVTPSAEPSAVAAISTVAMRGGHDSTQPAI